VETVTKSIQTPWNHPLQGKKPKLDVFSHRQPNLFQHENKHIN